MRETRKLRNKIDTQSVAMHGTIHSMGQQRINFQSVIDPVICKSPFAANLSLPTNVTTPRSTRLRSRIAERAFTIDRLKQTRRVGSVIFSEDLGKKTHKLVQRVK